MNEKKKKGKTNCAYGHVLISRDQMIASCTRQDVHKSSFARRQLYSLLNQPLLPPPLPMILTIISMLQAAAKIAKTDEHTRRELTKKKKHIGSAFEPIYDNNYSQLFLCTHISTQREYSSLGGRLGIV